MAIFEQSKKYIVLIFLYVEIILNVEHFEIFSLCLFHNIQNN